MRQMPDENSPSYAVACFKAGLLGTRPMDEVCNQPPGRIALEAHLLERMTTWLDDIHDALQDDGFHVPATPAGRMDAKSLQQVCSTAYDLLKAEWMQPAALLGEEAWLIPPDQVNADLALWRGQRARLYVCSMSVHMMSLAANCMREETSHVWHTRNLSSSALYAGKAHAYYTRLFEEGDAETLTVCELRIVDELGVPA